MFCWVGWRSQQFRGRCYKTLNDSYIEINQWSLPFSTEDRNLCSERIIFFFSVYIYGDELRELLLSEQQFQMLLGVLLTSALYIVKKFVPIVTVTHHCISSLKTDFFTASIVHHASCWNQENVEKQISEAICQLRFFERGGRDLLSKCLDATKLSSLVVYSPIRSASLNRYCGPATVLRDKRGLALETPWSDKVFFLTACTLYFEQDTESVKPSLVIAPR